MHWHRYKDISKFHGCRAWVCEECGDFTETYPYFDKPLFVIWLCLFGIAGLCFLKAFVW